VRSGWSSNLSSLGRSTLIRAIWFVFGSTRVLRLISVSVWTFDELVPQILHMTNFRIWTNGGHLEWPNVTCVEFARKAAGLIDGHEQRRHQAGESVMTIRLTCEKKRRDHERKRIDQESREWDKAKSENKVGNVRMIWLKKGGDAQGGLQEPSGLVKKYDNSFVRSGYYAGRDGKILGQYGGVRIGWKPFRDRGSNSTETSADTIVDYLGSEQRELQHTPVRK
jgi:hypothetical protein